MTHLEDLVLDGGVDGTRQAINFLRSLRDMFSGHASKSVDTTVKWDGCLHEDTVVLTNKGEMTIKEIVDRTDLYGELRIMGKELDSPLQYDHMVPLIEGHVSEGIKSWVEIEVENGSTIKLTEDHEVHTTNRGWVKAGELNEDDDITEL